MRWLSRPRGSVSESRQLWSARAGIVEDVKENETTAPGGVAALDDERRYQAAASKDPRFDGVFFTGVTSTGIYCRPSCPAITPKRENMRFYRGAAAAQEAGFRACKRCRPDASPGSPEWNIRADVVGRAMRLIADGVVDRDGVEGLASRLGYEQRQVRRLVGAARFPRASRSAEGVTAKTSRMVALNCLMLAKPAANAISDSGSVVVSVRTRAVWARCARAMARGPAPSSAVTSRRTWRCS